MAEYLFAELNPRTPKNWGAQVDYLSKNWTPWTPDKTVVHYGGNATFAGDEERCLARGFSTYPSIPAEMSVLRIYEQSHLSRGWRGLAYNYAIGQSGTLYLGRAEQSSGATSGDYEGDGIPENEEARAVLFLIGGDQVPSEAALETFRRLWALTPPDQQPVVIGHRDVKGTTRCPGPFLLDWVHEGGYITDSNNEEDEMLRELLQEQDASFFQTLQSKTGTPGGDSAYWSKEGSPTAGKAGEGEWDRAMPEFTEAVVEAAGMTSDEAHSVEVVIDGQTAFEVVL